MKQAADQSGPLAPPGSSAWAVSAMTRVGAPRAVNIDEHAKPVRGFRGMPASRHDRWRPPPLGLLKRGVGQRRPVIVTLARCYCRCRTAATGRREHQLHRNRQGGPSDTSRWSTCTGSGDVSGATKGHLSSDIFRAAAVMPTGSPPVYISFVSACGRDHHGSRASSVTPLL